MEYIQHRKVDGAAIEMPTESMMIVMPSDNGLLVFNFVTLESLLDKELPTFEKIMKSYHSIAQEDLSRKPK